MIRNLEQKDRKTWDKLYAAYADFYKVPMNKSILNTLWNWIHDENHIVRGICFELKGLGSLGRKINQYTEKQSIQ